MRIQHNIMAMNAYRNYTNNVSAMKGNLEKLSSGYKINRAGDDAAGLAISEKMRAQITGLQQAQNNAKSGINLVQTAEGALQEVQDMLNRMVKLAEQSANGTYDVGVDRKQLQKEFDRLTDEIDRIADSVNFNGIKLLDGSLAGTPSTSTNTAPATISDITMGGSAVTPSKKKTTEIEPETSLPTNVNGVSGSLTGAAKDEAVKVAVEITSADKGATGAGKTGGDLDGISIDTGDDNKTAFNGYTVTFAAGAAANAGAVIDDTAKTITVTLDNSKNNYSASDIEGLLQGAKDAEGQNYTKAGVDLTKISVSGSSTVDASDADFVGDSVKLSGGAANGDTIVTVSTDTVTEKTTVAQADWTGDSVEVEVGGLTVDFKAGSISSDITATPVGTIKETEATEETLDLSAATWMDGDSVKIDGKTYTYAAGADGEDGKTFSSLATLAIAADKNGVTLDTNDATNVTATKATTSTTGGGMNLQIGDTAHIYNRITVSINSIKSDALIDLTTQQQLEEDPTGAKVTAVKADGITAMDKPLTLAEISVDTEANAREALGALKGMVNYISDIRGELGATQNRLNHTINNLSVMTENIQDAESTIRDTDVADEMMAYTKNNILIQSAQAMLAQANQVPQGVLQLLQ